MSVRLAHCSVPPRELLGTVSLALGDSLAPREAKSTADIAAAAEITRRTLYLHFPARESFIQALGAAGQPELRDPRDKGCAPPVPQV
jgi:hypothetical protein